MSLVTGSFVFGIAMSDDRTPVPPAGVPASPTPGFAPTVNVAGGRKHIDRSLQRIGVRVDGQTYFVTYQQAAEIIARKAAEDAARQRAEKSRRQAKLVARKAAQTLNERLAIEQPFEFNGIDNSIIADRMFKDLRGVYADRFADLLDPEQVRKREEESKAMRIAEMMLLH